MTTNSFVVVMGTPEQLTVVRPTPDHWRHLVPHDAPGDRPLHAVQGSVVDLKIASSNPEAYSELEPIRQRRWRRR